MRGRHCSEIFSSKQLGPSQVQVEQVSSVFIQGNRIVPHKRGHKFQMSRLENWLDYNNSYLSRIMHDWLISGHYSKKALSEREIQIRYLLNAKIRWWEDFLATLGLLETALRDPVTFMINNFEKID